MIRTRFLALCACALLLGGNAARAQCSQWMWLPGSHDVTGPTVNAVCAWQPPAALANGVNASWIASGRSDGTIDLWDGHNHHSLPPLGGPVNALVSFNGYLIAGGSFPALTDVPGSANLIRWDGTAWSAIPSANVNGAVNALLVHRVTENDPGRLLVGGAFTSIGGNFTSVGMWTNSQWGRVGQTPLNAGSVIRALAVNTDSPTTIYAGGGSTFSADVWMMSLSDSIPWSRIGTDSGVQRSVVALAYYDHALFAGGSQTRMDANSAPGLSRYNGVSWSGNFFSFGTNQVSALLTTPAGLVACGQLSTPVGSSVIRWSEPPNSGGVGGAWQGTGFSVINYGDRPFAVCAANGELIVSARAFNLGNFIGLGVARWSESGVPWICSQTAGPVTVCGNVTLSALAADGYNVTYQWLKNGQTFPPPFTGGNTPTLTGFIANNVGIADVHCVVSAVGGCGSVSSAPVTVNALYPPTFLNYPTEHTVCPGQSVQLYAEALHENFIAFRWQALLSGGWTDLSDNGAGNACGDVLGSGGSNMLLTDGPAGSICNGEKLYADGRQFRCVASGSPCAVTYSPVHTLHFITDPPVFSLQPVEQAACPGGAVTYTVAASRSSGAPITFQWLYYEPGLTAWIPPAPSPFCGTYTGGDTPSITITDAGPVNCGSPMFVNGRRYRCRATSDCFSVMSDEVVLWVDPADIGQQGGVPGSDHQHDNNDFIVFINLFFAADPLADMGRQGGLLGHDGAWDNNDFIVFINRFFDQCP